MSLLFIYESIMYHNFFTLREERRRRALEKLIVWDRYMFNRILN